MSELLSESLREAILTAMKRQNAVSFFSFVIYIEEFAISLAQLRHIMFWMNEEANHSSPPVNVYLQFTSGCDFPISMLSVFRKVQGLLHMKHKGMTHLEPILRLNLQPECFILFPRCLPTPGKCFQWQLEDNFNISCLLSINSWFQSLSFGPLFV